MSVIKYYFYKFVTYYLVQVGLDHDQLAQQFVAHASTVWPHE